MTMGRILGRVRLLLSWNTLTLGRSVVPPLYRCVCVLLE